mgnify:CR=1 FL=1
MKVRTSVRRMAMIAVLAVGLAGAPAAAAVAAPGPAASVTAARMVPAAKPVVKTYKNCTALNKVHRGGVAKAGVTHNKVNGKKRAFGVRPTFSTALYNANKKMDRDKDGIACEKG